MMHIARSQERNREYAISQAMVVPFRRARRIVSYNAAKCKAVDFRKKTKHSLEEC